MLKCRAKWERGLKDIELKVEVQNEGTQIAKGQYLFVERMQS